ncbi:hypothetical protein ACWDYH_23880 [Nocardia goodfellowii]|uniref:Fatty acid desaturase n=1 Tax=Nocardia goodfellowii TaxID=882446 RepID=A0ABS4QGZ7_9NOCA|nr:hypothetical protein [Nocardia goodfellowii]MBP2190930.1 fatty acid desaturase [Nocardia goodfellowii]
MPIEQTARIVRVLEVIVTILAACCLVLAWIVDTPPGIMVIFAAVIAYGSWTFTHPIES